MTDLQILELLRERFGFASGVSVSPEFKGAPDSFDVDKVHALMGLSEFLNGLAYVLGVKGTSVLPVPKTIRPRFGIWFGKTGNARVNYSLVFDGAGRGTLFHPESLFNPVPGYAYLLYHYGDKVAVEKLIKYFRGLDFDALLPKDTVSPQLKELPTFEVCLDALCDIYNRGVPSTPNGLSWLMARVKDLRASHSLEDFREFTRVLSGSISVKCDGATKRGLLREFNAGCQVATRVLTLEQESEVMAGRRPAKGAVVTWVSKLTDLQIIELGVITALGLYRSDILVQYISAMVLESTIVSMGGSAWFAFLSELLYAYEQSVVPKVVPMLKQVLDSARR